MSGGVIGSFVLDSTMQQEFEKQGHAAFEVPSWIGVAQAVILVSHLVLYAVALVLTIILLNRRVIAFWVPLAAGVLAALIMFGLMFVLAGQASFEAQLSGY
jgi:hypothetical protein